MGRVVRSLMHGWNLFKDGPQDAGGYAAGNSMGYRASRPPARYVSDRSILASIYTRLAVDFSQVEFFHAMTDDKGIPMNVINDDLQNCLSLDPNIDQTAQHFKQDIAMTMFEQGHAAVIPVDMDRDPVGTDSYNIKQLRVGRVVTWFPRKVTVEVYDDRETDDAGNPVNGGVVKQMTVPKEWVAIVENPFYTVMNEPNGLLMRLQRKLAILDALDEAAGSGKLDIIFQLPYTVRGDKRKAIADQRRKDLADQLKDDELGIGYIDVSEKVIQLNRPVTNKLLEQIEYLYKMVFAQLGLTQEIMDGSAGQDQINIYYDRTIEPLANATALEFKRKFLTKTARTRKHSVEIYRDPLKLIPISELAEIVDKLLRNAAITANELRPKIGYMPSSDPLANQLRNPNMPNSDQGIPASTLETPTPPQEVSNDGVSGDAPGS
jgi:hypothetical protein